MVALVQKPRLTKVVTPQLFNWHQPVKLLGSDQKKRLSCVETRQKSIQLEVIRQLDVCIGIFFIWYV